MPRQASAVGLGLRLRLTLTLAAVALFPIAAVSYVIVRDEVGNVTHSIDFEVREAAVAAQARFARLLNLRELHAVAAASSPRLQAAIGNHATRSLNRFARHNGVVLEIDGREYGRRLDHAATARVQLVSGGRTIGSVVAQLPADTVTLRHVSEPAVHGVRLAFVGAGGAPPPQARGATVPVGNGVGIRAYLPSSIESHWV